MRIKQQKYGVELTEPNGGRIMRIIATSSDEKHGHFYDLVTKRQTLSIRVTKSGMIRIGTPSKATFEPETFAEGKA